MEHLDRRIARSYYPVIHMDPETFEAELAARGLDTQVKAADAIGISQGAVSLYKNGKLPIPKIVAVALRGLPRTVQDAPKTRTRSTRKSNNR